MTPQGQDPSREVRQAFKAHGYPLSGVAVLMAEPGRYQRKAPRSTRS